MISEPELYADFKWLSDKKQWKTFLAYLEERKANIAKQLSHSILPVDELRVLNARANELNVVSTIVDIFIKSYEETQKEKNNA